MTIRMLSGLAVVTAAAFCADPPKSVVTTAPDTGKPIAEIHLLKLENITLRIQLLQKEADRLDGQYAATKSEICSDAKLALENCDVDLQKKVVRAKVKPPVQR